MAIPSLDVLVSLVTLYIVLAVTVSAFTEFLTRLVGLRSIGLKSGIRSILQDPKGEKDADKGEKGAKDTANFWKNGIIKSATDGDASPNTLDALTFATATLSTIASNMPRDNVEAKALIEKADINDHLKEVLTGLADRAMHRGTSLHDELAQHFDATMEKIGQWYRQWTHGIALLLAIGFTVYLNANTLDLLHQLTSHAETRLELARIQSAFTDKEKEYSASHHAKATSPDSVAEIDKSYGNAVDHLADAYKIITKDTLGGQTEWPASWGARLRVICGLLITILAVSLGAPFWFDVLGRINPKTTRSDRPSSSISIQPIPPVPPPPDK
jgi:hypothetical protein